MGKPGENEKRKQAFQTGSSYDPNDLLCLKSIKLITMTKTETKNNILHLGLSLVEILADQPTRS